MLELKKNSELVVTGGENGDRVTVVGSVATMMALRHDGPS